MSAEIIAKVPFAVGKDNLEVWVVRDPVNWEFSAHVRKDATPIALIWPDGQRTQNKYFVSFETQFDAQNVLGQSAVVEAVNAAKSDARRMPFEKIKTDG